MQLHSCHCPLKVLRCSVGLRGSSVLTCWRREKKTCWRRQWQDIGQSPLSSSLYAPPTHSHEGKAMWTKCIQWFKFNPLKDRFHTKWRIWFPIKLTIFNCMGDERWVCVVYLGLKGKMCAVTTDKVLGLRSPLVRFPASIRVRFDHRLRALLVSHYHNFTWPILGSVSSPVQNWVECSKGWQYIAH